VFQDRLSDSLASYAAIASGLLQPCTETHKYAVLLTRPCIAILVFGVSFRSAEFLMELARKGSGIAVGHAAIAKAMVNQGYLVAPVSIRIPVREACYLLTGEEKI
jgi:hypothetical protein